MQISVNTSSGHYVPFVIMSLAMIVPSPARFAVGLVLVLELNILVVAVTALKSLKVWKLLADYKTLLTLTALIAIVALYSRLLGAWSPETEMQLGFVLYLQAASSFIISTAFGEDDTEKIAKNEDGFRISWNNVKKSLAFSVVALVIFAFRDIAGYGTITYPVISGIKEHVILKGAVRATTLFATIPGAFLCTGGMLALLSLYERGKDILLRAEAKDD